MSARIAAARCLLRAYPLAWRRRYGGEMEALVEDDPPSGRALLTLLTGALRAHLRPGAWRRQLASGERMRLSVWATFCCWIGLSIAGAVFQKETEEGAFTTATSQHGLLGLARGVVIAGAALGAGAIAVGGLPLLWQAVREARSRPLRRTLLAGLVLPPAGLALFAAVTAVVLAVAPAHFEATSTGERLALLGPWWAAGAAFALACALAPRIVLDRLDASPQSLRRASYAGLVLLVAMALVTSGLAGYCIALARAAPPLSSQTGGPLWPSTGLVLAGGAALAAACTALAAVSATRALAAARA